MGSTTQVQTNSFFCKDVYLFLAALGPRGCQQDFSSRGEGWERGRAWRLLFARCKGFSVPSLSQRTRASEVVVHGLSNCRGVVQWWPAAGLGALSVAVVHAWDLLKEVTIIFITSTIVSVQFSSDRLFATS